MSNIKAKTILLASIPEKDRCYSLCFDAVKNNPMAIMYVPVENVDDEILDMVFDAGRVYIRNIPFDLLTPASKTKIKFQYPEIGIEFGLVPMEKDPITNKEYISENFMSFLLINGEQYLERIPTQYYSQDSIELLKLTYPEYCLDAGITKIELDGEYAAAYQTAKSIVGLG
jgi:hypothetical protein